LNEAALVGEDDRLGAVVEVELLEDSGDVGLDRGLAEDELAGGRRAADGEAARVVTQQSG
jgi:hypothetical protein